VRRRQPVHAFTPSQSPFSLSWGPGPRERNTWALTASWPAVVACRLALSAAIACKSTSLVAAAVAAGATEGVVHACRNASAEHGGVQMGGGAARASVKSNIFWRDNDTKGAEH
jgi:hypothetical protein